MGRQTVLKIQGHLEDMEWESEWCKGRRGEMRKTVKR